MQYLAALLLALAQGANDWTGTYESGPGETATHTVIVARVQEGYECQWYDREGRLQWYGVLVQNKSGEWIENYDPERSPLSCRPYRWFVTDGNQPAAVTTGGDCWTIRRVEK